METHGDTNGSELIAVSQRWWDVVWRDGEINAIDEFFTDPFMRHSGTGSELTHLRAYKARLSDFQRVLSRAKTVIDDRVVAGDRVWTRATSDGVNRETGARSVMTWLIVQRIRDERIVEHWVATFPGLEWNAADFGVADT